MTARRQISLPDELCASAEQQFGGRFGGLELFVEFVLRELVRDDAEVLDRAELAVLEKRLLDLGYL
jgi:Arc/MetJ family transcription regulator